MIEKVTAFGEYITIDMAAKVRGVSYPALYKWVKRNKVNCVRLGPTLLIKMADIQGYRPRI